MSSHKDTLAGFLKEAGTLIENARSLPEVARVLAGYGYNEARFEEGARLWAEADALVKKQSLELGGKREASKDFGAAWEVADSAYMKTLKVARVAFGGNAKAIAALKLYGPRKQTLAGWLDQASTLYSNLAADAELAGRLDRFGYSPKKLKSEAELVEGLKKKSLASTAENGLSQTAKTARDRKLKELDTWVSELRTISKVAFFENPQELEKLGIKALNGRRRSAKTAAAPSAS